MKVMLLHPEADPADFVLLFEMLDESDPRPAREQFDAGYRHGGGWNPIPGLTIDKKMVLHFPGDPPFEPLLMTMLRGEMILFYEHGLVAIVQQGGSFEVSRMD